MREDARLRKTKDVRRVRQIGVSRGDRMFLVSAAASPTGRSRLAVSTPASLGGAVVRNRARRRARAAFAPLLDELARASDLLVGVREGAVGAPFADLQGSAREVLRAHGLLEKPL